MKKLIVLLVAVALFQNWGKIDRFFNPPQINVAEGEVVLYSTSWCGYCRQTRELLADHGIPYVEYDIEQSDQARREYEALGGAGVPVLNSRGTVIHGYNREAILASVQ